MRVGDREAATSSDPAGSVHPSAPWLTVADRAATDAPDPLATASVAIASAKDDDTVGQLVVEQAVSALQACGAWLVLFDESHEWLEARHACGPEEPPSGRWLPASDEQMQALLDRGAALLIGPAGGVAASAHTAVVLLQLRGIVLGYLRVRRAADQPAFEAHVLPTLQVLADLAALRVGYSQLATRPRLRERELAELAEPWRPLPDRAGDYVLVTDLAGRVVDADGAACRLLGYSREELLQLGIPELSPVPADRHERGALAALFARARAEGAVVLESSVRRRDCTLVPVRVEIELLEHGGQTVARGVGWDLSERQAAQARLLQTERLRVLGQLASGVAHDLNNTLAHVLGNLQLLLDRVREPSLREELERIQRAALDGAQTVRRLHTFARARDRADRPVDLSALLTEVVEMTRPSWEVLTQQQGISVRVSAQTAEVPVILANAGELREVLVNLVYNALDAMPKGGDLRLSTAVEGQQVIVAVSDSGMGMPANIRNRVFDPFFTTKGAKGTGLGLAVAYTIITRHGGQISVDSEEGKGTTFTIRLPVPTTIASGAPPAFDEAPAPPPAERKARILAVDDEPDLALMLARMLQHEGHQVQVCNAGSEALRLLESEQFDLLLTDVSMPDMDGWEVARRATELRPGLPVGLVTGWGTQYENVDLTPRGITFLLSKPFSRAEACGQVARVLAGAPSTN